MQSGGDKLIRGAISNFAPSGEGAAIPSDTPAGEETATERPAASEDTYLNFEFYSRYIRIIANLFTNVPGTTARTPSTPERRSVSSASVSAAELRDIFVYILKREFKNDRSRVSAGTDFRYLQHRLPTGVLKTGYELMTDLLHVEYPDMSAFQARKYVSEKDLSRLIREKYLFEWSETPDGLVRAVRYIVEYIFNGNTEDFFADGFDSKIFSFMDGIALTGAQVLNMGRRFYSWETATDSDVLSRLYEMAFTVRRDDESTTRRILRYILDRYYDGDPSKVPSPSKFSTTQEFVLPDGSRISGKEIMTAVAGVEHPEMAPRTAYDRMGRYELMQVIKNKYWGQAGPIAKMRVSLEADEARLHQILSYLFDSHQLDDTKVLFSVSRFWNKKLKLQDGTSVKGSNIMLAVARAERLELSRDDALKKIGGEGILRIIREKYLFRLSETSDGLIRAVRHIVEYIFKGDQNRLFDDSFESERFLFPDGKQLTGERILELARQMYSSPDAVDKDVLKRLYEDAFTFLRSDEMSIDRVMRHIVAKYFEEDVNQLPFVTDFKDRYFTLPDGSTVKGYDILMTVLASAFPERHKTATAMRTEMGWNEAMDILREKHLFRWSETPEGLVRAMRYIVNFILKAASDWVPDDTFKSKVFSFRNGFSISGTELTSLGREKFSWTSETDEDVLKKLYEKAFMRLRNDESSLRRVLQYVYDKYFGSDPHNVPTTSSVYRNDYILPDGSRITGLDIYYAVAKLERPDLTADEALKVIGFTGILNIIKEKHLGLTPPDLSRIGELPGIEIVRSPADILMLVHTLLPDSKRASPGDILAAYAALNLGEVGHAPGKRPPEIFIEAFKPDVSVSGEQIVRLADIYINLLYQEYSTTPAAILPKLERLLAENKDPVRAMFYRYAISHFKKIQKIKLKNIKSILRPYQLEAVKFLRERNGALLADEPGMGKTVEILAAAESVHAKRVLIVTHPRVVSTWKEEIEKHLEEVPGYIVLKSPSKKKFAHREANSNFFGILASARYIIVNYEALREAKGKEGTNPLLQYLKKEAGLDTIVVDEFQNVDNPKEENQQAEAVRQLDAERRWIVSASPYQSKIENLFVALSYIAPNIFVSVKRKDVKSPVSPKGFKPGDKPVTLEEFYKMARARDANTLKTLNALLNQYMLRRPKGQVLGIVDPSQPPETQRGRLPKMVYVPYQEEGAYEMTEEHAAMMAQMVNDFRTWALNYNLWAARHNVSVRKAGGMPGEKRTLVDLEKLNPASKLGWLKRAMIDPEYFGMAANVSFYQKLDETLEKYISQGKKVIFFANYTRIVDSLWKRYYHKYGAVRLDGKVKAEGQEQARHKFNNDPVHGLLVGNPRSGGVGINLPADDVIIYIGQPQTYVWRYQSEHRANRADPTYVKAEVRLVDMIGQYPKSFLDRLGKEERQFLDVGTVAEIEHAVLSKRRMEFEIVMNGVPSHREFERSIERSITSALGWNGSEDAATEGLTLEDIIDEDDDGENNGNGGTPSVPPAAAPSTPSTPPAPAAPADESSSPAPNDAPTVTGLADTGETSGEYYAGYHTSAVPPAARSAHRSATSVYAQRRTVRQPAQAAALRTPVLAPRAPSVVVAP